MGGFHPGAECNAVSEELTRDLLELVNANTGRPVVREILRTAAHFEGNRLADLPDLLVEWNPEAPITAVRSPKVGEVRGVYLSCRAHWRIHAFDGLYLRPTARPGTAGGEFRGVARRDPGPDDRRGFWACPSREPAAAAPSKYWNPPA